MPRSDRIEFNRKTRNIVHDRSAGRCENRQCGASLKENEGEYDHVLPAALGGEATAANCMRLCKQCHKEKTTRDVRMIRKGDRQRDKNRGTFVRKSKRGLRHPYLSKRMNGDVIDTRTGEIVSEGRP